MVERLTMRDVRIDRDFVFDAMLFEIFLASKPDIVWEELIIF